MAEMCVDDRIMYLAIAVAKQVLVNTKSKFDQGTHIKSYVSISEYCILISLIVHPIWSKVGYLCQTGRIYNCRLNLIGRIWL